MAQMQSTSQNKGLRARDFATLGIFSAILFVIQMIVGAVTTNPLVLMPWAPAICALVSGPFYLLMVTRVHKRGAVLIPALVIGVVWALMGGIPVLVAMAVAGAIGEVAVARSQYKSFAMILVAFVLFCVAYHFGSTSYVWVMADFMRGLGSASYPPEMIEQLVMVVNSANGYLSIVGCAVAAVAGGFLGKALLKKHFVAAGIVRG